MQQVKQMPAARVSQRFEDFVDVHTMRWSMEVHHKHLAPLTRDVEPCAAGDDLRLWGRIERNATSARPLAVAPQSPTPLILMSLGLGWPCPVSTSDFKLIR
jgi:hypothetical protein